MANTARYWRINHLSIGSTLGEQGQTSGANINFAELYFYAQSTDTTPISGTYDLSQSRTSWNNSASNLTDGDNLTTVWNSSSGFGTNIMFDAGAPTTIGKVRISSINNNYYYETPIRWVLEASQDNVTWIYAGVLTVETTAWTQGETRDYTVSPSWLDAIQVSGVRAYVASEPTAGESIVTAGVRAYVVSEPTAGESIVAAGVRAYVVSQEPSPGGIAQGSTTAHPEFIQGTTKYVKFEPETNNKKLLFWPDTAGDHTIIALRANLLDFYEATQTFALGSWQQVYVPHFNQLFITSSTLTTDEVDGIKNGMLSRATGTGIDIDAGTENSVPSGLKDPSIFGVIGPQPQVSFLLGTESGIQDEGYYSITMTPNGGVAQSSAWAQFGTYSAAFNLDGGTDDHYNLGSPATCHMDFGTEDFTIEGFAKATNTGWHCIIGNSARFTLGCWAVFLNPSNQLYFEFQGTVSATATTALGTDPFHFAVCREGNNLRMYVNGVLEVNLTDSKWARDLNATNNVKLGDDNKGYGQAWEGYIDELRVVKGVAVYSGSTLTVPTAPYPRP